MTPDQQKETADRVLQILEKIGFGLFFRDEEGEYATERSVPGTELLMRIRLSDLVETFGDLPEFPDAHAIKAIELSVLNRYNARLRPWEAEIASILSILELNGFGLFIPDRDGACQAQGARGLDGEIPLMTLEEAVDIIDPPAPHALDEKKREVISLEVLRRHNARVRKRAAKENPAPHFLPIQ